MENDSKFTPPMGNPLYTHAEQRAILAVMRDALALSTTEIMIWVKVAPHCRLVEAYGYLDGWQTDKRKSYDINLSAYLADNEAEALTQLAVMACDLREAVATAVQPVTATATN